MPGCKKKLSQQRPEAYIYAKKTPIDAQNYKKNIVRCHQFIAMNFTQNLRKIAFPR